MGNERISKKDLHHFIRYELKNSVESDWRLIQPKVTEYTLQAVIWDHLSKFAGEGWAMEIEAFVPGLDLKADIVIYRLTLSRKFDERYGAVAIEVKPNGQIEGIKKDIRKLQKYFKIMRSPVNFGVMIYFSRSKVAEKTINSFLNRLSDTRKIVVLRIVPP